MSNKDNVIPLRRECSIEVRRSSPRMVEPRLRRRLELDPRPSRTGLLVAALVCFAAAAAIGVGVMW